MRASGEVHLLHRLLQIAAAGSIFKDTLDVLGFAGGQVVLASHDAFAGFGFEFQPGTFGNVAADLGGGFHGLQKWRG